MPCPSQIPAPWTKILVKCPKVARWGMVTLGIDLYVRSKVLNLVALNQLYCEKLKNPTAQFVDESAKCTIKQTCRYR